MADILAYGEALIEFNQADPGSTSWNFGFGGDTSTFCIAAARQGARPGGGCGHRGRYFAAAEEQGLSLPFRAPIAPCAGFEAQTPL